MTPDEIAQARLRVELRHQYRDRADAVWHAVYYGELDEKGPHRRVRGEAHAAQMADEGVESYFEALFARVVNGAPNSQQIEKRRGAAPKTTAGAVGSIRARLRAQRTA